MTKLKPIQYAGIIICLIAIGLLFNAGFSAGSEYIDPESESLYRSNPTSGTALELDQELSYQIWRSKNSTINSLEIIGQNGTNILHYNSCEQLNSAEPGKCKNDWIEYAEFDGMECSCTLVFNGTGELLFTEYGVAGDQSLVDEWTAQFCGGCMVLILGLLILVSSSFKSFSKQEVGEYEYHQVPEGVSATMIQQPANNED